MTARPSSPSRLVQTVYLTIIGLMALTIAGLSVAQFGWPLGSGQTDGAVDPDRLSPEIPAVPPSPAPVTQPALNPPTVDPAIAATSNLRVSNQTQYPLRVVLLPQAPGDRAPAPIAPPGEAASLPLNYTDTVHWDFAPAEGNQSGLLLSLPDQQLQLQPGDVLMAFALDGSQVYWGPYVVGTTAAPTWAESSQEWQLILTATSPQTP